MRLAEMYRTLDELLVCAYAWEADARLLGNVRAADMREALYRAREAVRFVERYAQHHVDAVRIAGHEAAADAIQDAAGIVLEAWPEGSSP